MTRVTLLALLLAQSAAVTQPTNHAIELSIQTGHSSEVAAVHFADVDRLVSVSYREAIVWDLRTGLQLRQIPLPDHSRGAGLSHDRRHLITGGASGVHAWSLDTGQPRSVVGEAVSGTSSHLVHNPRKPMLALAVRADTALVPLTFDGNQMAAGPSRPLGSGASRSAVSALAFDDSGSRLAIGREDGSATLLDIDTGRVLAAYRHDGPVTAVSAVGPLFASGRGSQLSVQHLDRPDASWSHTFPKRQLQSIAIDSNGTWVAVGTSLNGFVFRAATGERVHELTTLANIRTQHFSPDGSVLAAPLNCGGTEWMAGTGHDVQALISTGNRNCIGLWTPDTGTLIRALKGVVQPVYAARFAGASDELIVLHGDTLLKRWDTREGRVLDAGPANRGLVLDFSLNTAGSLVAFSSVARRGATFAAGDRLVVRSEAAISGFGTFDVVDARTNHVLATREGTAPLATHPSKPWVVVGDRWGVTVHEFSNPRRPRVIQTLRQRPPAPERSPEGWPLPPEFPPLVIDVSWNADGSLLAAAFGDGEVLIWPVPGYMAPASFQAGGFVDALAFDPARRELAGAGIDGTVRIWDLDRRLEVARLPGHTSRVLSIAYNRDGTRMATASLDGTVRLWEPATRTEIARLISVGPTNSIAITPDFYYMAPRAALDGIAFRRGDQLYPFEQFDTIFNRPDIVLSRLGHSSHELISALKNAYERRLRALGLTSAGLSSLDDQPRIVVHTGDMSMVTTADTVSLPFTASSSGHKIAGVSISVNGVPVHRLSGSELGGSDGVRTSIPVRLTPGANRIRVAPMNEAGVRGPAATVDVTREGSDAGELYVAAVGVNAYQERRLTLSHAAGDATAVLDHFTKYAGPFRAVHTWTLPEARVTRGEVLGLVQWLAAAREEDQVLLFFAGHGFLGERLTYYFGTVDVDHRNPSRAGLSYAEIEGLLTTTRARRKVLILDTCHSGENDAPEDIVLRPESGEHRTRLRGFRGFPTEVPVHIGLENTFALMRHVFADIREGTGAEVIAAAGGLEVTIERSDSRHSPLTTALLEALAQKMADANGDGALTISELRDYVTDRVEELSEGRQHAVSRRESALWDFRVY